MVAILPAAVVPSPEEAKLKLWAIAPPKKHAEDNDGCIRRPLSS